MIYSVFAGLGKSYTARKYQHVGNKRIVDAESSAFQWLDGQTNEELKGVPRQKNPKWPENYIDYIASLTEDNIVLISAQPEVLALLAEQSVSFATVTPDQSEKEAYRRRYIERGNTEAFADMMTKNFEKFIDSMDHNEKASVHYKVVEGLGYNRHLIDLLNLYEKENNTWAKD